MASKRPKARGQRLHSPAYDGKSLEELLNRVTDPPNGQCETAEQASLRNALDDATD